MGRSHQAALLHSIIEKCQCRSCTRCAAAFQPHFLQYVGNRVTNCRSRSKGKVDDAEWHTKTPGSLTGNQLAYTGNLEGSLLDGLSHLGKVGTLQILKGMLNNARAADTYADNLLRLTDAVESTCHERIVPRGVGKHYQLGTAQGILVTGKLGSTLDNLTHLAHTVHVDASLGRTQVDRGAYHISGSQCLGNGVQQDFIAIGKALFHQCRKTADEVYAHSLGSLVQGLSYRHIRISLACLSSDGNRGYGNALVNDRNTILSLDILTGLYKKFGRFGNLIIHIAAELVNVRMSTITQGNAHGNGAHIQLILRNHAICF